MLRSGLAVSFFRGAGRAPGCVMPSERPLWPWRRAAISGRQRHTIGGDPFAITLPREEPTVLAAGSSMGARTLVGYGLSRRVDTVLPMSRRAAGLLPLLAHRR